MSLHLDVKIGDTIQIGRTKITVSDKSGRRVKLAVDAPPEVPVSRLKDSDINAKPQ